MIIATNDNILICCCYKLPCIEMVPLWYAVIQFSTVSILKAQFLNKDLQNLPSSINVLITLLGRRCRDMERYLASICNYSSHFHFLVGAVALQDTFFGHVAVEILILRKVAKCSVEMLEAESFKKLCQVYKITIWYYNNFDLWIFLCSHSRQIMQLPNFSLTWLYLRADGNE